MMHDIKVLLVVLAVFMECILCAGQAYGENEPRDKIRIVFEQGEVSVLLFDNPLAREFAERLPMEVEFEDFSSSEKIFYLDKKLDLAGALNADQLKGDFCYYAPWGNIAVFYKGYGHGKSLYTLGLIETGKEALAAMKQNFRARIELIAE